MIPRRVVRELERQLTREPGNLTVRVTLAAAYRELGRSADAVEQYRLVAAAYLDESRVDEAIAACTSALAMAADDRDLLALQTRARAAQAAAPASPRRTAAVPMVTARKPSERSASSSASDLETPLPPPVALHDTGDSLIGLPRNVVDSGVVTLEVPSTAPLPSRPLPTPLPPMPAPLPPAQPPPPVPSSSLSVSSSSSSAKTVVPGATPLPPPPRGTVLGPAPMTPARGGSYSGPLPRLTSPPVPQPRGGALPRPSERVMRTDEASRRRRPEPVSDPSMEIVVELDSDPAAAALADDEAPETLPADDLLLDVAQPVVALTDVRRAGPPAADLASELATRRRPRLTAHELELLDLEVLGAPGAAEDPGAAVTEPRGVGEGVAAPPPVSAPGVELPDTALDSPALAAEVAAAAAAGGAAPLTPGDFVDDEPTQPPEPGREHPFAHGGGDARDADAEGGTFAGGFTVTLAELAPDGTALDGPLGVFSMLPPEAANELARRAVVKLYDDGEVVVREGDVGDACFVIARGEVVITRHGAGGEPAVELARLGEGALFGEFALLADRRRHATVTALGEAEIYVIPRLLLRELAAIFPDVGPALERFYRERLLANLITTSPLFARLAVDQRAGLLSAFEPMRVESGQAIVRQGERAGGLFLIVLGAVEVVCRTDDRRAVVLATLGEGAYVGEISLLTGDLATASVIACGPVELAALPAKAFYRVVSEYPELWAAMRDEADARRLRTARVLAGRTGVV